MKLMFCQRNQILRHAHSAPADYSHVNLFLTVLHEIKHLSITPRRNYINVQEYVRLSETTLFEFVLIDV